MRPSSLSPWSESLRVIVRIRRLTTCSISVQDSQALVLDAGHIAVESNLADKDQLKEVQSKRGRQYNDEDYKQLETLMYDRFSLQLQAAQVS